jgi:hypothetical protein
MIEAVLAAYITVQTPPSSDCRPLSMMLPGLRAQYKETPFLRGITERGTMMMLLINPARSSWTLLEITPDMVACIRSSGNALEPVPYIPDGRGT